MNDLSAGRADTNQVHALLGDLQHCSWKIRMGQNIPELDVLEGDHFYSEMSFIGVVLAARRSRLW